MLSLHVVLSVIGVDSVDVGASEVLVVVVSGVVAALAESVLLTVVDFSGSERVVGVDDTPSFDAPSGILPVVGTIDAASCFVLADVVSSGSAPSFVDAVVFKPSPTSVDAVA